MLKTALFLSVSLVACATGDPSSSVPRSRTPDAAVDAASFDLRPNRYPDLGVGREASLLSLDVALEGSGGPLDLGVDLPSGPPPTLVISEIMPNPAAVADSSGEWLEIYNPGANPVDLKGWQLRDQGSDLHVIQSQLVVASGAYVVLARKGSANGGIVADYVYGGAGGALILANSEDEIALYHPSGALVDEVVYRASAAPAWPITSGASISLKSPELPGEEPANWCVEPAAWSGSAGDKGSPGKPSGC